MNYMFANRMASAHKSFIREILKVTADPKVISFAGGLPNPRSFPVKDLADAAAKVLAEDGENVLQYSTTEGHLPLREYIAERYSKTKGLEVEPDEILMISSIEKHFPEEVEFTRPEGGMFLWVTLPESISALRLFDLAGGENVAFVPGSAFYVDEGGGNTLRLNFSNADGDKIEEGIERLAKVIRELLYDLPEVR